jgi:hypothetical protein
MEKIKLFIVGLLLASGVYAQQASVIREGLIKTYATLSPGLPLKQSPRHVPYYLHGNLEYYAEKNVSLVGDIYLDLKASSKENNVGNSISILGKESPIRSYLDIFFGANYHWTGKRGDFYIGIQPGIAHVGLKSYYYFSRYPVSGNYVTIRPLASLSAGYNYFVSPFFHFFIQSRFVSGRHRYIIEVPLTELRFSGGLGFNLNTMRQKN